MCKQMSLFPFASTRAIDQNTQFPRRYKHIQNLFSQNKDTPINYYKLPD